MRLFRSRKGLAAVVAGSFIFAFAVSSQVAAAPVRVASVDALDVGNGECDFDANELGRGSATDPFLIGSPSDLAEMIDCSSNSSARREKTISAASVSGSTVTFTTNDTHGAYGVGQVVTISGVTPSDYDITYARVTSATETEFSIEVAADLTSTAYVSGGTVKSEHDFYELTADIDLGSGSEDWNDTRETTITSAVGDGSEVTYTVADSSIFEVGDDISIKGNSNNDYNTGNHVVASIPDGNTVKVNNPENTTAGTGGTISHLGWNNFDVYDIDLDGNGYTISNLTIDNEDSYQGLFGSVYRSNFGNLNMTGVDIEQVGANGTSGDYVGALASYASGIGTSNISVSGNIVATNEFVGMVVGYSLHGNHQSLSTSGSISFEAIDVSSNTDSNVLPKVAGGVFGFTYYESFVDIDSEVSVLAVTESADGTYKVYGDAIGGIFGKNEYSGLRNATASGNVTGGRRVAGAVGEDRCCSYTINATASGDVRAYSNSNWGVSSIGGFYGEEDCCSTRDNVTASGDVIVEGTADNTGGLTQVGGLMGYYGCCGSVLNSSSTGAVTVTNNGTSGRIEDIGGFMGAHYCCGDVLDSFSTGDVTVVNNSNQETYEIGGFIGEWSCCGTVRSSYSEGDVSVTVDESATFARRIGGFMGAAYCCGAADATYATGNVTVNYGYQVGGHTGWSDQGMQYIDSYATGNVTVGSGDRSTSYNGGAAGGFIGTTYRGQELTRVSATGDVTLTTDASSSEPAKNAGGLIGYVWGNGSDSHVLIKDSYYRGAVSGPTEVGGLIGGMDDTNVTVRAERVYVSAEVDATEVDGVIDSVASGKWTDPSGQNFFNSTLAGASVSEAGFNARTTAQLKTASTYTAKGWSFTGDSNPWRIAAGTNEGYPYLVPVVMPGQGSGTDWTRVKTLSYAGSKVALTTAKKRALRQAATQLIADGCTKVQLRSRPNLNNYDVAAERVKRAHTYLAQVFDNRGADLPIVSNVRVRPNSTNKNTVQVFCGAE